MGPTSTSATPLPNEIAERRRSAPGHMLALEQLHLGIDGETSARSGGATAEPKPRKPCAATCSNPCDCDHD